MKDQFYAQHGNYTRQDDPKVKELFDDIEKIKVKFEAVERPILEVENSATESETPYKEIVQQNQPYVVSLSEATSTAREESMALLMEASPESTPSKMEVSLESMSFKKKVYPESVSLEVSPESVPLKMEVPSESVPLKMEVPPESVSSEKPKSPKSMPVIGDRSLDPKAELAKLESEFGQEIRDYSTEEIGGWEFDELKEELKSSSSSAVKID
ncbi:hypothetical protein ACLOJK_028080 [Asimina triloba]